MINKQNRSKVFLAIIGVLLVANIVLVSFLLLRKEEPKHENQRPDKKAIISAFLKNEMGFDAEQLKQYDTLSDRHKENMKKLMDSLRTPKEKQFAILAAADFSDSAMNMMATQSSATQRVMELQMFNHLKKIRLLCTPAQLPKFDSTFGKVLSKKPNDGRRMEPRENKELKEKK